MKKLIFENLPEIILLAGLFFIILGCFLVHYIAGVFSMGLILSGMGVFLAKKPIKK